MGVIAFESLGKMGYQVPPWRTMQVTLLNPKKIVMKMFVVIYDLQELPANHQTFLQGLFVSLWREKQEKENIRSTEERYYATSFIWRSKVWRDLPLQTCKISVFPKFYGITQS